MNCINAIGLKVEPKLEVLNTRTDSEIFGACPGYPPGRSPLACMRQPSAAPWITLGARAKRPLKQKRDKYGGNPRVLASKDGNKLQ